MINGPTQIFVERAGKMVPVPTVFHTPGQLDLLVDNLLSVTGRGVNAKAPMVDFRLEARLNIIFAGGTHWTPVLQAAVAKKPLFSCSP